jgi:hypothetical protein
MTPHTLIISAALITACGSLLAVELPPATLDPAAIAADPMRYLENDRLKLGIHLGAGGAITYLEAAATAAAREAEEMAEEMEVEAREEAKAAALREAGTEEVAKAVVVTGAEGRAVEATEVVALGLAAVVDMAQAREAAARVEAARAAVATVAEATAVVVRGPRARRNSLPRRWPRLWSRLGWPRAGPCHLGASTQSSGRRRATAP